MKLRISNGFPWPLYHSAVGGFWLLTASLTGTNVENTHGPVAALFVALAGEVVDAAEESTAAHCYQS